MLINKIIDFCNAVGADIKAFKNRNISAGNGLSGGGDLTTDRSISLGTPSTLTGSTTNAVTSTSHTHAVNISKADVGLPNVDNTSDVDKPISTVTQAALDVRAFSDTPINAGAGLTGGGNLTSAVTITLGTPTSVGEGTANTVTATSHTHAVNVATAFNRGIVRLATSAEAIAGTETTKAVTPSGLQDHLDTLVPTVSSTLTGTLHGTKGVWRKGNAGAYFQFTAKKSFAKVDGIMSNNVYFVGAPDSVNFRLALYNSSGTTRMQSGPEVGFQVEMAGIWAITPVMAVFTGLTKGVTYRVYVEGYEGGNIGGWDLQGGFIRID